MSADTLFEEECGESKKDRCLVVKHFGYYAINAVREFSPVPIKRRKEN